MPDEEAKVPRLGPIGAGYAQQLSDSDKYINWTMHPAILPALVAWLDSRDCDLVLVQNATDEELPTAIVSPRHL